VTAYFNSLVYQHLFDLNISGLNRGLDFNYNTAATMSSDSGFTLISVSKCFPSGIFPVMMSSYYYNCGNRVDTVIRFYISNKSNLKNRTQILYDQVFYRPGDTIGLNQMVDSIQVISHSNEFIYNGIFTISGKAPSYNLVKGNEYFYNDYGTLGGDSVFSALTFADCIDRNSVIELNVKIQFIKGCRYTASDTNFRFYVKIDYPSGRSLTTDFMQNPQEFSLGETIGFNVTAVDYNPNVKRNPTIKTDSGIPMVLNSNKLGNSTTVSFVQVTINCEMVLNSPYHLRFYLEPEKNQCVNQPELSLKIPILSKDSAYSPHPELFPNIFSPNGDGKNDYFLLEGMPEKSCTYKFESFTVLDRWGSVVYVTNNQNFQWEGSGVPDGVYFYVLDLKKEKLKGNIQVLR
ncbi:MAG: gliding motility-associated C-terminal domain-containing protein, partial [Cytophagales bacterium]|nr:gliding motility-associated C-terminal domain-containing protein [Cytophagales bacterium]